MTLQHNLPFDPTYGYTLETLLRVGSPTGPADFESFWRNTYAQTMAVPMRIDRRAIAPIDVQHDLLEIEFDSLGGRVGGWLAIPKAPFRQAMVIGHGYGGRGAPELMSLAEPTAMLFPCAGGFDRSQRSSVPNVSARHVLHGIHARETYIHRFNVAELWSAASVLLELFPETKERLFYAGSSFGGGLGAMMLPWDARVTRAFLEVPSFGNHPLRLTLPCTGSGEAVRLQHQHRGDVLPVMQYFDAATAARFIHTPTMIAAALFDPAVPPPGQFAVYNAIPAEKKLFVKTAGHFGFPGEADELQRMRGEIREWFSSPPARTTRQLK